MTTQSMTTGATLDERATLNGSDRSGEQSRSPNGRWHSLTAAAVQERLGTSESGLDARTAAERLRAYGPNIVEAAEADRWWTLALRQFRDPLIYILLIAAALTFAVGHFIDAWVILTVVLLNGAIGFVQEARARRAMQALASLTAPLTSVIREKTERQVPSRELVPGDVVVLTSGARVSGDIRLTRAHDLEIDESAMTGESLPVVKITEPLSDEELVPGDQLNMAFGGTTVTRGRGRGIVVRTGAQTELGRIASAMRAVETAETPLHRKFEQFGRRVGVVIVVLSLSVFVIGTARAMPLVEIFLTAVAIAVSAIPEGLPVVLTVTLAVGARRMAKRRAIVRSLPAVETLGSTTVIGSDKTGTLTKNEMTVRAISAGGRQYRVSGVGYGPSGMITRDGSEVLASDDAALGAVLLTGVLANETAPLDDHTPSGDPTEIALLVLAAKGGLRVTDVRREHHELDLVPFESDRRFMASLRRDHRGPMIHLKGAPEVIIARCSRSLGPNGVDTGFDAAAARDAARALASQGLRVLATAHRAHASELMEVGDLHDGFVFTGLVGMEDPPRPEAIAAIADARAAGIRVVMLTGDHVETARAVGVELGLCQPGDRTIAGQEMDALADAELDELLTRVNVFARVAPEHKLRIVQRLQHKGEVVAVTGDGVNDAPALRAAHLGVAMGASGTDVAREAADMVLADDNFATITAAIEEGRVVFANIRKATFFLLSSAAAELLAILAALLSGWPIPFTAVQILWISVVTDGLQDAALAFEPGEPGLLKQRPRSLRDGILNSRHYRRLAAIGALTAVGTLAVFWWALRDTGSLANARSVAVTQMVVFQFYHVFNCRSLDRSILSVPLLSNRFLFVSMITVTVAHLAAMYVPWLQRIFGTQPLTPAQWVVVLLVGSTIIVGGEIDKLANRYLRSSLG